MQLSVVIIAYNEERNIERCLKSVLGIADEIIVVDSFSTDRTAKICLQYNARIIQHKFDGYGAQKRFATNQASFDYVLSLDADERVSDVLAAQIQEAISNNDNVADAFAVPRLTQFCGKWIRHCGWTPDLVLRLFKRGTASFSNDLVHEKVLLSPGIRPGRLRSHLLHYSYPTPAHYWRKLEQYSQAWAAQRGAQGQKTTMWRAGMSGLVAFVRSYFFRLGFLDGAMGFAVCTMQAQAAFGKYFALYCLSKEK